jgi:Flp pilus assembly secretin CpaC
VAEHLHQAADHLQAAGRSKLAEELRQGATELRSLARQHLKELRAQQRQIDVEIQRLEQTSGLFDQVQIRASLLEMDVQKLKDAGISLELPAGLQAAPEVSRSPNQSVPHVAFNLYPAEAAAVQLQALKQSGAAKVLSEPALVTRMGVEADVFSGGEFPRPVPQSGGTLRMAWEEVGVRLSATPQILDDGRLRLDLASSLSERDFENAVTVQGIKVPGVPTRRIGTQIDMRFGETLILGTSPAKALATPADADAPGTDHDAARPRVDDRLPQRPEGNALLVFLTAEPIPSPTR